MQLRDLKSTQLSLWRVKETEKVEQDKMTVFGNDEVFGATGVFHFLLINFM